MRRLAIGRPARSSSSSEREEDTTAAISNTANLAERFGLGPIDQLSYAVRDMKAAVSRFDPLFGPFEVRHGTIEDLRVRGRKVRTELIVAFGASGPLEIELVQPLDDVMPQAEFLERHGEGLHHVRFKVDDIDGKAALLMENGYTEVMAGRAPGVRFAYLGAPDFMGDSIVELLQSTD
jgi:4-hydroxyphenylpyruvate dioxygenase-like putative hemolysin